MKVLPRDSGIKPPPPDISNVWWYFWSARLECGSLVAFRGQRPGTLLNVSQCAGQPSHHRIIKPTASVVLGLRNTVLVMLESGTFWRELYSLKKFLLGKESTLV